MAHKTYDVYLDLGEAGTCMAHVLEILGANVTARNKERAMKKILVEIPRYINWLHKYGERIAHSPRDFKIQVVETVSGTDPWNAGGVNALFSSEKVPPTDSQISIYMNRLKYSRDYLMKIINPLPEEALFHQFNNEPRTIENTLWHIAQVEWWYLTRMDKEPGIDLCEFSDVFEALDSMRNHSLECLSTIPKEELRRINIPWKFIDDTHRQYKEEWTWHKVFRRFIEHERQHTRYIERIIREDIE